MQKKKGMLNEGTIRRFQKLANIQSINEMHPYARDEEEGLEAAAEAPLEEPGAELEEPAEDLGGLEDLDEPAPEGEEGKEVDVSPEELLAAKPLLDKLTAAALDMEGEEEGLEEPIGDEEVPVDDAMAGPEEEMGGAPFEEPSEEEEIALEEAIFAKLRKAGIEIVDDKKPNREQIVKEVMKRVAKRLIKHASK